MISEKKSSFLMHNKLKTEGNTSLSVCYELKKNT